MRPRVLVIAGPTAVGKTETAILVARRLGGEIISADSMQVYRGFDIGTAKPTPAEQQGIPHHLIDIRDPWEEFSVVDFQNLADQLIREINARGRLPILVGGTGFYIRATLRSYTFAELETDGSVRAALYAEADRIGAPALHRRLAEVDPEAAARIHPNDKLRIVRALEVYTLTGQPISRLQQQAGDRYDHLLVGLQMDREELYRRINQRVDRMLAAGWLEEVRRLLAAGGPPRRGPMANLGYRELVAYLRGLATWEETVDWIKRNTRRYAKRQLTWFRREPDIRWVDAGAGPQAAAEAVCRLAAGKWPDLVEKSGSA
nr:MAG: tRNA (adenosine(37)-N6)-dimethylallyltransferase MiaA [Bacillota bacterium]